MAANNAAYYYHFDGLGSVVAVSNSNGDSCQSYEYSAYGQVAASDPNFIANPYMFTGRRFDIETGLYYYRARYYNPHIGRFMQTDPVGYGDGINWYLYCRNNPLAFTDPSGLWSDPYDIWGYLLHGDDLWELSLDWDIEMLYDCFNINPEDVETFLFPDTAPIYVYQGEDYDYIMPELPEGKEGWDWGYARLLNYEITPDTTNSKKSWAATVAVVILVGEPSPIGEAIVAGTAAYAVIRSLVWASKASKDAWDKKERARKAARKKTQADKVGHRRGKLTERGSRANGHPSRKKYRQWLKKFCPICGLPRSQCPGH